jgi:hypothetical protein
MFAHMHRGIHKVEKKRGGEARHVYHRVLVIHTVMFVSVYMFLLHCTQERGVWHLER